MTSPILIGLHGVQRAGKNVTADFITELAMANDPALSVRQRGFADKAKWAYARQYFPDITMEDAIKWVDEFKFSGEVTVHWDKSGKLQSHWQDGRTGIRQFATDGARDIYGQDFWVDQLLPLGQNRIFEGRPRWIDSFAIDWDSLTTMAVTARVCLITDERFPNEVKRVKDVGGVNWKIKRKDAEDAIIKQAEEEGKEVHRSDLSLPDEMFDVVIDNSDNNLDLARTRTALHWNALLESRGIV